MEPNHFSNFFCKGTLKKHFSEIILKSGLCPRRRCRLKCFFSTLSSGGHFVLQSRTSVAVLVKGNERNISVKLFEIGPLVREEMSFKVFLFLALAAILFSRAKPFRQFW